MISIRLKNFSKPPDRLLSNTSIRQIRTAARERSGRAYSGNVHRDDSVTNLLRAYSLGKKRLKKKDEPKCFYCESKGEAMVTLQVEHFRPLDAVNKVDLIVGQIHNGYYWLGNEWSNLLLSCGACNGAGAKGTRFPIGNNPNRVFHDQPVSRANKINRNICLINSARLLPEFPILLNPEFDTPEYYIQFNKAGKLSHIPGQIRGEITIEILKLNRDPLLISRQKVLNTYLQDIKTLVELRRINRFTTHADLQASLEPICKKIISQQLPCSAYSFWGIYINNNIDNLITNQLPTKYRKIFRRAYNAALLHP